MGAGESSTGLDFQERDVALLRGLFESRVMSAKHVAALYFEGRNEAAKKRLQKLKTAGLINERPRRPADPSILFLSSKAFKLLSDEGALDGYPKLSRQSLEKRAQVSSLTLRHELDVMDVKAALVGAIREAPTFSVSEFSTWPVLYQFEARRPNRKRVIVKPDGFIRVQETVNADETHEHTYFLEVDRSTETQDTLADRAGCYLNYYKSGGLAVRFGQPTTAFKEFPFRVLMVFKNAERRNNTAERLLQNNPPIFTQVWLTTFDEVTVDPLGPVWVRPADYREATRGTAFDLRQPRNRGYKRCLERERLVASKVRKWRIFEDGTPAK